MRFNERLKNLTTVVMICVSFFVGYLVCSYFTKQDTVVKFYGAKLYYDENGVANKADLEKNLMVDSITKTDTAYMININTASKDELKCLPSVGDKTAENIISYRETSPFKSVKEIMNVEGIGEKTYAKLEKYICIE